MIPMNVSFYIHRVGEWTLLMLGECVFSLVIVPIELVAPCCIQTNGSNSKGIALHLVS